jgi:hypothetical protein
MCDTIRDKDTLLNCDGIIPPMGQMSLFLTFAPTADDTIRTSLPKEIRLMLRSRDALFYQRGLVLSEPRLSRCLLRLSSCSRC